jgi:transcriptional regulator with XRE-family HTH domain
MNFRDMIKNTLGSNLTLAQFAKVSQVSLRTLNRLMKADETYSPNKETLKRLEKALDSTKPNFNLGDFGTDHSSCMKCGSSKHSECRILRFFISTHYQKKPVTATPSKSNRNCVCIQLCERCYSHKLEVNVNNTSQLFSIIDIPYQNLMDYVLSMEHSNRLRLSRFLEVDLSTISRIKNGELTYINEDIAEGLHYLALNKVPYFNMTTLRDWRKDEFVVRIKDDVTIAFFREFLRKKQFKLNISIETIFKPISHPYISMDHGKNFYSCDTLATHIETGEKVICFHISSPSYKRNFESYVDIANAFCAQYICFGPSTFHFPKSVQFFECYKIDKQTIHMTGLPKWDPLKGEKPRNTQLDISEREKEDFLIERMNTNQGAFCDFITLRGKFRRYREDTPFDEYWLYKNICEWENERIKFQEEESDIRRGVDCGIPLSVLLKRLRY